MALPAVVAHADWGTAPRKRQVAVARLAAGADRAACYVVTSLAPAPDGSGRAGDLLHQLAAWAGPGQAMAGFDFPIGLPRGYARAAGIGSFPEFLDALGSPPWQEFGLVATRVSEIALSRPFYPAKPGGTRRDHLYQGLGLAAAGLRRRCEGRDAETLFWTLGGKQVGKAALEGWPLLAAARRRHPPLALWPFAGPLHALLGGGRGIVVAETYLREYYRHFRPVSARSASPAPRQPAGRLPPQPASSRARWSKRRHGDRLAWIPAFLSWAESLGVTWDTAVLRRVEDGLSPGPYGEDEFDAVVGLLGMIAVITGTIPSGEPGDDPAVTATEGWILGRPGALGDASPAGDTPVRQPCDASRP